MCKHCERIKKDDEFKPVMHAFMELVAKNLNRQAQEEGKILARPITADDVDPNDVALILSEMHG